MPDAKAERRSRGRLATRVPVSIKASGTGTANGFTRDLSLSGIFLYTDTQVLPGSKLEMVLMLPPELTQGEKRWVCCEAAVVRVEHGAQPESRGIAAEIRNIATLPEIPG